MILVRKIVCNVVLFLVLPTMLMAAEVLFSIQDPQGDDNGGGKIVYPSRDDFAPGDLDLLQFSARVGDGGTWFEARFKNKIRSPHGVMSRNSPQKLDSFIHEDFYTINLEVYIDTDARTSSGNRMLLPGRVAEVDSGYAWEKAVIATPRPQAAEALLDDSLTRNAEAEYKARSGRLDKAARQAVDRNVKDLMAKQFYFPKNMKVRDRTLAFYVPDSFFGNTPQESWRYVVVVTGADPEQALDVQIPFKERPPLMMLPVRTGRPSECFGLEADADPDQPPLIDVLLPSKEMQYQVLGDYNLAHGQSVQLIGVSTDGTVDKVAKHDVAPEQASTPSPAPPGIGSQNTELMDTLLSPSAPKVETKEGIVERLQTLEKLRKEGLITEQEYQQLRRKILSDL